MGYKQKYWVPDEHKVFLKSWKEHAYMCRFLKQKSNKDSLYSAIRKDLRKHGYDRSLIEIMYKLKNLRRRYRQTMQCASVNGTSDFRWYNKVEEILKIEKTESDQALVIEHKMRRARKLLSRLIAKGNASKSAQVVTTNVSNDESDSDSNLFYSSEKLTKPEVQNNIRVSVPQLSGSNTTNSTETILLNICREFRRSNRQLEGNDIAILELFKEQNEIFKKQTSLIMKLL